MSADDDLRKCFATACHELKVVSDIRVINNFTSSRVQDPIPDNMEPLRLSSLNSNQGCHYHNAKPRTMALHKDDQELQHPGFLLPRHFLVPTPTNSNTHLTPSSQILNQAFVLPRFSTKQGKAWTTLEASVFCLTCLTILLLPLIRFSFIPALLQHVLLQAPGPLSQEQEVNGELGYCWHYYRLVPWIDINSKKSNLSIPGYFVGKKA